MRKLLLFGVVMFVFMFLCANVQAQTYPQLAVGNGYVATVIVTNYQNVQWEGDFLCWRHNANEDSMLASNQWQADFQIIKWGTQAQGGISLKSRLEPRSDGSHYRVYSTSVPAYGTVEFTIYSGGELLTGYLQICNRTPSGSSNAPVAISYFYQYWLNYTLVTSTGSEPSEFGDLWIIPVRKHTADSKSTTQGVDTGVAWAPYQGDPTFPPVVFRGWEITLELYDSNGVLVNKVKSLIQFIVRHSLVSYFQILERILQDL